MRRLWVMILTNNNHRFYDDKNNLLKIENNLIFNKYSFCYAKDDHNILIVNEIVYNKIIEDLKEIIDEH